MGSARHIPTENASALYASSVVLALAIHAGMLYGWKDETSTLRALEAETAHTEVELFETASQSQEERQQSIPLEQSPAPPPSKEPPPLTPTLESLPPPTLPEAPPVETPPPAPIPPPIALREPTPALKPVQAPPPPNPPARLQSPASSKGPAKTGPPIDNGTTRGEIAGKMLGKPVYKIAPIVRYPAESRTAGEQGTVVLRIRANAEGKPVEVTVLISSGFSRLDRAAIEGGWRSRIDNSFEGAQFEAPLRFSLKN